MCRKCRRRYNEGEMGRFNFRVTLFKFALIKKSALVFCLLLLLIIPGSSPISADELMDIQKQLEDITRARELSVAATTPLEAEVDRLEGQITSISRQISAYELKLTQLEDDISVREDDLAIQFALLSARIRSYYKRTKHLSPFLTFFSSTNASDIARSVSYQAAAADEDRRIIVSVTGDLIALEDDKAQAEDDRQRLAVLQSQLDKEAGIFPRRNIGGKGVSVVFVE